MIKKVPQSCSDTYTQHIRTITIMIKASSHLKKVCAPYSEGWIRIYLKDYGHFLRHQFMHSSLSTRKTESASQKKKENF